MGFNTNSLPSFSSQLAPAQGQAVSLFGAEVGDNLYQPTNGIRWSCGLVRFTAVVHSLSSFLAEMKHSLDQRAGRHADQRMYDTMSLEDLA